MQMLKTMTKHMGKSVVKHYKDSSFNLHHILGEGLTSKVFKVSKVTNSQRIYALKKIHKSHSLDAL